MADNPTRTLGIEQRWRSQFNIRYKALKGRVNQLFANAPVTDVQFVEFFNQWFNGQIEELIYDSGATVATIWQNTFIEQSYAKGLKDSLALLNRDKITLSAFTPENVQTLRLLKGQSYNDLKGITAALQAEAARDLTQGILENKTKAQLAVIVNNRVDKIGRTRSHTLVNTRTVETYNTAQIKEAEAASEVTDEEVRMLWVTRGDSRVRTTHALRNRKLYTTTAAQRLIGEPGCRCGLKIQIGEGTAAERKARTQVRKQQLRISEQAIKEKRFFESIGQRTPVSEFGKLGQ